MRNLGIVAHIDAGKTTVSERMLFYSGVEHRMGEVHEGTAVMDWMEEERRRGITITAAATTLPWRDHSINLIDTPGHVDFTVEVERSMRVLDGAVLVLNGVAGVQAQSEAVWRQMERHRVPYVVFVNQCDRPGADFFHAIEHLKARLGVRAMPIQLPLGVEKEFRGVVDLITGQSYVFDEADQGFAPREVETPPELLDDVGVLRAELVDTLAEEDEDCLEAALAERVPPPELLRKALRARTLARTLVPVLAGAALRNVGIQRLMDAVIDFLPSPLDVPPIVGRDPKTGERLERHPDPGEPTCSLAFKLQADPHEDLTFVRVYSGVVRPGEKLWNPRTERMERISRVLRMHAEERQALEGAGPGEIVALTGCKLTATGDTLCDRAGNIVLERLEFPEPVITKVVEPAAAGDRDKLRSALDRLAFEDPTFHVREDEETGQWLIAGMGELHLEVLQHRLEKEFRVEARVGEPRVAYREAARVGARGVGLVDRVLGGKEIHGHVEVELAPKADATGVEVVWADDGAIPAPFRATVEEALSLGAQVGPRFGFPLVHAVVRIVGGGSNPAKDADLGFAQAAATALRHALGDATIDLLEPVMSFEVQTPADFASGIIAELNSSRAEIADVRSEGPMRTVVGTVPLAHMFGFSTTLRSLSQGRASFSMSPAGFRRVPDDELEERGLVWH